MISAPLTVGTKYHSIKFEPEIEWWLLQVLSTAEPGDVITIPHRPICINVKVLPQDNIPADVLEALKGFSLASDCIVLPIYEYSCSWDSSETPVWWG